MEFDKKRFKKLFPHLSEELVVEEHKAGETPLESGCEAGNKIHTQRFFGYKPDVVDFIRRCHDDEQAGKIIDYLESQGKISKKCAKKLVGQLKERGLRSFGPKKEENYYLKNG